MSQVLVAALAKLGMALAEAIVTHLMWELWSAFARSRRQATAAA